MTITTTDRLSNDIGNGDDDDDDDGDRGDGDGGRDEPDGPSYDEQAWIDTKGIVHKRTTAQDKQCFKKADNASEQHKRTMAHGRRGSRYRDRRAQATTDCHEGPE